jgi:hypothetical protein
MAGLYFAVYTALTHAAKTYTQQETLTLVELLAVGGSTGVLYWTLIFPADLIRYVCMLRLETLC